MTELYKPHKKEYLDLTQKAIEQRAILTTQELSTIAQRQEYLTNHLIPDTEHEELLTEAESLIERLENLKKINL